MANNIGWGQGAVNNSIGWGQGASSNSISWGISQKDSYSGETEIYGIRTDVDALAFNSRVTANGGTLSTLEQTAINQLVVDLKAYGLWNSMKAIYPMVGASAAACAQNLKSSSFTGTFAGGWTFASTGATPNGTSAYMNTGLNLSTQTTLYNVHYSNYILTQSNKGIDMGVTTAPSYLSEGWFSSNYNGNLEGGFYDNAISSVAIRIPTINSLGFFVDSIIASNNSFVTQQNVIKGTNTATNITTPANTTIVLGGVKDATSGNVIEFSNKKTAFASIGDGLTTTQASNFYTAVQAFQTTLSRQV
jgi:hypothetical protein